MPFSAASGGLAGALRAATVDALPHGVVVTDARHPELPIVQANDAFLRLTGYRRADVLGANCRFLQGPGTDPAVLDELRAALREDRPFLGRLLNYRRDGSPFWNLLSITPLHDEDGVTSHHVASQTDVTPLCAGDVAAEQAARLAVLDSFARGVAHDFNNVLLAASGYAELLATRLLAPEQERLRGYAEQIVDSCETGGELTQRLLGSSRDRASAEAPVDVAALAAETAALARGLLPAATTVHTRLPGRRAAVLGHRAQLRQLLLNLLAEARGDEVTLAVSCSETSVLIEVAHAGDEQASGLAALATNAIVRRHAGSIDVRRAPGEGTTAVVSLPRAS